MYIKKVLAGMVICFSVIGFVDAKILVFSNEQAQTQADGKFVIDVQNYENEIELKFGDNINASIVFDRAADIFKINRSVDFQNNEIKNVRLEQLASAPTCDASVGGKIYFNTSDSHTYACDGILWGRLDVGATNAGLTTNSTEQTIDYDSLIVNTINYLSDSSANRPENEKFIVKTLGDVNIKTQVATNTTGRFYRVYESAVWGKWNSIKIKKYASYSLEEIDQTDGTVSYISRTRDSDSKWLITKSNATGFEYAQIENNAGTTDLTTAWNNRLTLTYDLTFTP